MKRPPDEALRDMIEHARKALDFVGPMDFVAFSKDDKTRFAAIRALEVVGEAARAVPETIRSLGPSIPWARIVGMRNFLAHDYMGVNPRVVFDTVRRFLPDLIVRLEALASMIDAPGRPR